MFRWKNEVCKLYGQQNGQIQTFTTNQKQIFIYKKQFFSVPIAIKNPDLHQFLDIAVLTNTHFHKLIVGLRWMLYLPLETICGKNLNLFSWCLYLTATDRLVPRLLNLYLFMFPPLSPVICIPLSAMVITRAQFHKACKHKNVPCMKFLPW